MGMPYCYSIPVKAKVYGWSLDSRDSLPDWQRMLLGREEFEEWKLEQLYHPQNNPNPSYTLPTRVDVERNGNPTGWVFQVDPAIGMWETKDFKSVSAVVIRKGDQEVYGLNTDQYADVGEITVEFFAADESTLLDFINDVMPGADYETDTTVHQWW